MPTITPALDAAILDAFRVDGPWLIDNDTDQPIAARCRRCHTVTDYDDLSTHSRQRYGKEALCKPCHVANVQARHDDLRARDLNDVTIDAAIIRRDGYKECAHCRVRLPLSEFGASSREVDGTRYYCTSCHGLKAGRK